MEKYFAVILLLVAMLSSCNQNENKNKGIVVIEDVGISQTDSVHIHLDRGEHISEATVRLVGDVDGTFLLNETLYERGQIDSIIHIRNWDQPLYMIEYQPIEARNGYLMVMFEFR